mmetsp:Transcript_13951/g.18300  ORF Transcript_13951/g.18300 Transcript_13951/m.18300 type:complete len:1129 (+) Transcript_13951:344-3730(+)|eukprot:CAMPEP_0117738832 /NCGR_PEP_ID=MMETSP0947-20121206/3374_1 /TAXON_ID=44440 /ORGANISM="Chattonella subsalsa, Strain CCMP2191" /LENGTH=1128 /DNA_ID=CAMNT_0005554617 /DNA_START=212 /DNA_END=3598 /DNA_ORIENTATION=+
MLFLVLVSLCLALQVSAYPYPIGAPWPAFGGHQGDFGSDLLYQDTSNLEKLATYTLDATVVAPGVIDADGIIYLATRDDDTIPKVFAIERLDPDDAEDRNTYEMDSVFSMEVGVEEQSVRNSPVLAQKDVNTQIVIFGCDGEEDTYDDYSQIISISTNSTRDKTAKKKKAQGWQFPTDDDMATGDLTTRIGQIFGSGAIDDYNYLYWGTAKRSDNPGAGYNKMWVLDVTTGEEVTSCYMDYGVFATPLVHDDYLFVVSGGHLYRFTRSVEDGLDCNNPENLDLLSLCPNEDEGWVHDDLDDSSAPRNMPVAGPNDEVLVAFSRCVFSIDKDTMEPNWQYVAENSKGIYWNSPCVDYHGYVYAANYVGHLAALKTEVSKNMNLLDNGYFEPQKVWSTVRDYAETFVASPLCLGGAEGEPIVHIVSGSGTLFAVDEDGILVGGDATSDDGTEYTTGYSVDGKNTLGLGPNLFQDRNGFLYLPSVTTGNLLMLGGGNLELGGCAKGTQNNPSLSDDSPYPCETCAAGSKNNEPNTGTCDICPEGEWSGDERSTFCFFCEVTWWCEGGDQCTWGRGGTACARCSSGYFSIGKLCEECPANSTVTTIPVIFLLMFILTMIFRYTGANAYVTGTKFTYEIKENDVIRVEFKENDQTIIAQSKVKKVMTDFILELEKPLGNSNPIIDAKFMILESKGDGAGKVRYGTGVVSVPKKTGGKPKGESMYEKALYFTSKYICCRPVKKDKEGIRKLYKPTKVFGKTTSGTQVLGAAVVIGMTWLQMTTLFMEFDLEWPLQLKSIFAIFGNIAFFNVPDLLTAPECEWETDYVSDWFMSVFIPLILVFSFVILYGIAYKMYKNPATLNGIKDRCFQAALIIIIVMYVLITAKAWEPLDCTDQPNGRRYMDADPSYECVSLSQTYYGLMEFFAGIMFVCYGFGIPIYLFRTLSHAKKKNKMGDMQFIQRYGWLYLRYNRDFYYWEIVMLVRKLFIVIGQKAYNAYPDRQAKSCIAIITVAFVWHMWVKPFTCYECIKQRKKRCKHWSANDMMEGGSLFAQILVLTFGLVSYQYSQREDATAQTSQAITIAMIVVIVVVVASLGYLIGASLVEQEIEKKKLEQDGISFEKEKGIGYMQMGLS